MPRVHQQVARKDYPQQGIAKGDLYYKWQLRYGPVMRSKTPPLPEQLTSSEYLQEWYPLNREIGEFDGEAADVEALIERARELGEVQQEKFDNMPEGLQAGDTGQLLQERAEECESLADTLEEAMGELEQAEEEEDEEERETALEAAREAVQGCAQ